MKLISLVLEFLFPPKCVLCGKILQNGELDLCRACGPTASRDAEVPGVPSGGSNLPKSEKEAPIS